MLDTAYRLYNSLPVPVSQLRSMAEVERRMLSSTASNIHAAAPGQLPMTGRISTREQQQGHWCLCQGATLCAACLVSASKREQGVGERGADLPEDCCTVVTLSLPAIKQFRRLLLLSCTCFVQD